MRSECLYRGRRGIHRGDGGIRLYLRVSFNAGIWRLELRQTSDLATVVATGTVDLFVLGLVCGLHVPIEAILQTKRLALIFYAFELFGAIA